MATEEEISYPGLDFLVALYKKSNDYDEIEKLVNNLNIDISNLFLPNTLLAIDNALSDNLKLALQLLNFLDIIKIYSYFILGEDLAFLKVIKKIIVENRTTFNENRLLGKNSFSMILFNDSSEINDSSIIHIIENNQFLYSIYVYAMLKSIFE